MMKTNTNTVAAGVVWLVMLWAMFAEVATVPPYPCTYNNTNGLFYNLSAMYRDPSIGIPDFQFAQSQDQSFYYVNVCGQAAETQCNPANGVCQVTNSGAGYGDGDASRASWNSLSSGGDGVQITLPNGSGGLCSGLPRVSYLAISCDTSAGDGIIDSVSESQAVLCQYTVAMRSKWACGISSNPPPPPPMPSYPVPSEQRMSLVNLFNATGGYSWGFNTGWLSGDPCMNEWFGITCTTKGQSSTITEIKLHRNFLTGNLSNWQYLALPDLTWLELAVNPGLRGSIPSAFGTSFPNLFALDLSLNGLQGTIPSSLGALKSLFGLVLSGNQLTGSIPSQILALPGLASLILFDNQLSGSLPTQVGTNLQVMILGSNSLYGTVSQSLMSPRLTIIDLSFNKLSGSLPSMSGLSSAAYLRFAGNQLIGSLPQIPTTGSVQILDLSFNEFNSTIPQSYSSIQELSLENNALSSPMPSFLLNEPNSQVLLMNNSFSCPLPDWCSPPPTGNGVCAPCVCSTPSCPSIPGYSLASSNPVPNCASCQVPPTAATTKIVSG